MPGRWLRVQSPGFRSSTHRLRDGPAVGSPLCSSGFTSKVSLQNRRIKRGRINVSNYVHDGENTLRHKNLNVFISRLS